MLRKLLDYLFGRGRTVWVLTLNEGFGPDPGEQQMKQIYAKYRRELPPGVDLYIIPSGMSIGRVS